MLVKRKTDEFNIPYTTKSQLTSPKPNVQIIVIGRRVDIEYPYKQIVSNKLSSDPKNLINKVRSVGVPNVTAYNNVVAHGTKSILNLASG